MERDAGGGNKLKLAIRTLARWEGTFARPYAADLSTFARWCRGVSGWCRGALGCLLRRGEAGRVAGGRGR